MIKDSDSIKEVDGELCYATYSLKLTNGTKYNRFLTTSGWETSSFEDILKMAVWIPDLFNVQEEFEGVVGTWEQVKDDVWVCHERAVIENTLTKPTYYSMEIERVYHPISIEEVEDEEVS